MRPPPEKTLLGVGGGIKEGGRIKFLPPGGGGSKYTPPPPPQKLPYGQKWGRGGGYITSPWIFCLQLEASCLQWSFSLTVVFGDSLAYSWNFCTYSWSIFANS